LSDRAVERSQACTSPSFHWAWPPRLDESYIYMRFGGTPPEQHVYALDAALTLIDEEGGIEATAARHRRIATAVHAAVEGWGTSGPWEVNALEPHRAAAVTCVLAGELDADTLRLTARDRFRVSLGGAMLELTGRAFRIGHLGDLNEAMILGALGGIETAMSYLDLPHGDGVSAAVAALAKSA
ncbi:MAG: hypothetical protein ACE5GB_01250, partial [Acidimicrobiales bacterium]